MNLCNNTRQMAGVVFTIKSFENVLESTKCKKFVHFFTKTSEKNHKTFTNTAMGMPYNRIGKCRETNLQKGG